MSTLIAQLRQEGQTALGVAGYAGYNVSAAQVDTVFSQLANKLEASGAADTYDRSGLSGDWANALLNAEPKGSYFPDARVTADGQVIQQYTVGYWTTQAYANQWDRLKNPLVEQHKEAPTAVISIAHVESGLVTLTPTQQAAYDKALADGQVTADGQVMLYQPDAGTSSAPASSLPAPKPDGSLPSVSGPIRPGPSLPTGGGVQTIIGTTTEIGLVNPVATPLVEIVKAPGTFTEKLKMVPVAVWVLAGVFAFVLLTRRQST